MCKIFEIHAYMWCVTIVVMKNKSFNRPTRMPIGTAHTHNEIGTKFLNACLRVRMYSWVVMCAHTIKSNIFYQSRSNAVHFFL